MIETFIGRRVSVAEVMYTMEGWIILKCYDQEHFL